MHDYFRHTILSTEEFMIKNVLADFSQVDLNTPLTITVNARATETANGDSMVTSVTISVPICPTITAPGTYHNNNMFDL